VELDKGLSGWVEKSIADIAPLQRGFDLPNRLLAEGSYPVVYSNGISNHHSSFIVKGPGVVTGRSGTIGRMHFIESNFWPHNTSLWVTSFKGNCPKFVYYLYSSIKFERFSSGSGVPTLNRNDAHSFKTLIPTDKKEQEAIANALSDADAYIESLEKLIAKKRLIKKGVMQELLTGNRRLEGFKKSWKEYSLNTLIKDFRNGYAFNAGGYVKSGVPIVTMAQIGLDGSFQYDEDRVNHWSHDKAKNLSEFIIAKGDLLIAMTDVTPDKNLIGRMSVVNVEGPLLLNQRVGKISTHKDKLHPHFLWHFSNSAMWRDYCLASATLGVQANIGTKDILLGKIILPDIDEQNAIVEIIGDIDCELNNLIIKLQKARLIKEGMMQELLTGRIRLV